MATQCRGGEVEKAEIDRLLDLVGEVTGQDDPGDMGLAQHRIRRGVAEGLWQQQLPDSIAVHCHSRRALSPAPAVADVTIKRADLYTEASARRFAIYCNLRSPDPFRARTITCRPIRQVFPQWVP